MEQFLLVILLLVAIAMIGLVMLQRSEGGALGIGGGGGAGGLMSARGSANLLTRATAILAALFMSLALALAAINGADSPRSIIDEIVIEGATVPLASDVSETPTPQGGGQTEPEAASVPVAE